jgi:3-methyladenine DNA glycosylase Mpg
MRIGTLLGAGVALLLFGNTAYSQQLKLGSNPYTIQKSALLELNSTNQGLLLARITDTASINTLSPPDGMVIYFTPTKQLMVRSNGVWQAFTVTSAPVFSSLTAGSIPYIGTGGVLSQNNANLFWDATYLRQGIGTNAPAAPLHISTSNGTVLYLQTLTGAGTGTANILFKTYAAAANPTAQIGALDDGSYSSHITFSTKVPAADANALSERMRITSTGNLGIGTTSPSRKLDVNGAIVSSTTTYPNYAYNSANRMAFGESNVPANETGSVVQYGSGSNTRNMLFAFTKTNVNTSYFGNDGTQMMLGSESTVPITFRTGLVYTAANVMASGTEVMRLTSTGNLGIGSSTFNATNPEKLLVQAGTTTSFNLMQGHGKINNYLQINVQNDSAGTAASSDLVATADNGNESANFIDMGINSSANTSTGVIGGANNAYLYSTGNDFSIGNSTASKSLLFFTGGTASGNEAMRINGTGKVGIGTTAPSTVLHVNGTNPLTLTGVQAGTSTSADSLLTITSGLVRKIPMSTFDAAGSGITSLNGLTAATQTFATGATGTDFNISSSGSAHTFNIPDASATARGVMTTGAQTIAGSKTFSSALNVTATNPLNLLGVQAGTSTTADSLLTITSGLVRKIPMSTFASASNFWGLGGNTVGSLKNFGTIDAFDLPFITSNTEKMRLSTTGNLGIGSSSFNATNPEKLLVQAGTTTSFNLMQGHGKINNYLQINVQNDSAGTAASSDLVATSDNGNESSNFIDMGINSSANTSTGVIGGANNAYLYSTGNDFSIGNSTASKSLLFFTGGTAAGNEAMRINGTGKVGIGTTAPSTVLHVNGTNPLTLTGVQAGTSTSADSLLTITSGLVRKIPMSTFTSASSFWALDGNTVGAEKKFGTIDSHDLPFITNNTEQMRLSSTGDLAIGTSSFDVTAPEKLLIDADTTNSYNLLIARGIRNGYLQFNIQNNSSQGQASTDIVATADNGTETTNYVNLGINGSGYNNASNILSGANNGYLYSAGQDFIVGNSTAAKSMIFFTGGIATSNERMRLDGTGHLGVGVTAPSAMLHLPAGTATAGTAPLKLNSGTSLTTPENGAVEYDGTNYYVSAGSTRYTLAKTLTATAALNFPSTTAGTASTLTITVTGAADGDAVSLGVPNAAASIGGAQFFAYVSAANTVTIKLFNSNTLTAIDPASATFRVSVLKY